MSVDAMKLALEALEFEAEGWENVPPITREAIAVLRERLAQPEQKPVAWRHRGNLHEFDPSDWAEGPVTPLYTTPPRREWQGLTEQEIKDCEKQAMVNGSLPFEQRFFFARAIEAKLKERNK